MSWSPHHRPGLHSRIFAGCWLIVSLMLVGCNPLTTGQLGRDQPADATDRIRNIDLQPQSPRPIDPGYTGSIPNRRAEVYAGEADTRSAAVDAEKNGAAAGAGTGRAPASRSSGVDGFELNFENTPITTVAKVILGDILRVGYVIDPRVQGTISLASGRPVPRADVLFVLENALRSNNVVMVQDVAGYRLMPASEAVGSARLDHGPVGSSEPGYGITVIPLQYVSVATVTKLLDSFALKAGSVRTDPAHNIVIVQGSGAERRAAVDTVLSFDGDWMRGQSVGIFPVHKSSPEPMIAELEKIMDAGEGGLSQGLVKFQLISRLGAILVVTRKPDLLRIAGTWISRLDEQQSAAMGVKSYRVRHGDARQIARMLNEIFVNGGSFGQELDTANAQLAPGAGITTSTSFDRLVGSSQPQGAGNGRQHQQQSSAQQSAISEARADPSAANINGGLNGGAGQRGQGAAAGAGILTGVRITADVVNNSVVIYASSDNYKIIENALAQLDRPRLQIAIDLTIAEVTLNNNLAYGVQVYLKTSDLGLARDTGSVINSSVGEVLGQSVPGFNFLVGSSTTPRLIIDALHRQTGVKILSNPSLVVVNNQTATLQVGEQVPITTGTATVLSANNAVVNSVEYRNTGIIMRVSPRINANSNVLLDIEQEISGVSDSSTPGSLTPTLSQRKVRSSIMVASGQTVLLAGLVSETQSSSKSGIPLLDQIPGIGDAFSQTKKGLNRTELIIFIRPQIIQNGLDASIVAEELRAKLRGDRIGEALPPRSDGAHTPRSVR